VTEVIRGEPHGFGAKWSPLGDLAVATAGGVIVVGINVEELGGGTAVVYYKVTIGVGVTGFVCAVIVAGVPGDGKNLLAADRDAVLDDVRFAIVFNGAVVEPNAVGVAWVSGSGLCYLGWNESTQESGSKYH